MYLLILSSTFCCSTSRVDVVSHSPIIWRAFRLLVLMVLAEAPQKVVVVVVRIAGGSPCFRASGRSVGSISNRRLCSSALMGHGKRVGWSGGRLGSGFGGEGGEVVQSALALAAAWRKPNLGDISPWPSAASLGLSVPFLSLTSSLYLASCISSACCCRMCFAFANTTGQHHNPCVMVSSCWPQNRHVDT